MSDVGIRELKLNTSEILRRVREDKESVFITFRGRKVAVITPLEDENEKKSRASEIWADMDELAHEIATHWPPEISPIDAIREQRREL